ncbi:DUF3299 domain-containing protein [Natronospira bacteriovora]|uniref:DUF3299 domain-containing protein n=1 Tax=Natronospira bacteriovora TaxID=3069753 RepID=A0ABU0W976_9GAMM|nr:DUF3299 domain-containing protein [Natronospira sp. AB-CW4]MDQ2070463.1 DUF3299 domain-containing protein [Natronospira sp. AB-CW4]
MRTILSVLLLLALSLPVAAWAQLTDEELASEPPPEDATFDDFAHLVPPTPEGAVSWDLLGSTEEIVEIVNRRSFLRPDYPDEVKALDGQTIRIKGFIYPMQNQEWMAEFLFTALPPSCPYCLPAGAGYIIETRAKNPIRFSWDAVLLEGELEVLEDDPYGLFYRLNDARRVRE